MEQLRLWMQTVAPEDASTAPKAIKFASHIPQTSVSLRELQQFGVNAEKNLSSTLITASAFLARELPVRTFVVAGLLP
jgi:hypothetical protein